MKPNIKYRHKLTFSYRLNSGEEFYESIWRCTRCSLERRYGERPEEKGYPVCSGKATA